MARMRSNIPAELMKQAGDQDQAGSPSVSLMRICTSYAGSMTFFIAKNDECKRVTLHEC